VPIPTRNNPDNPDNPTWQSFSRYAASTGTPWVESSVRISKAARVFVVNSYDPRPRNACPRVLSENVSLPTRNTTRVKRGDQNGPTLTGAVEHSRNTRGSSLSTRRECPHSDHRRLAAASSTWTVPMAPWLRATTAATRVRVARSIRFVLVTSPRPRTGFAGDSHFKRPPRGAQAAQVAGSALRETARGPMGPCRGAKNRSRLCRASCSRRACVQSQRKVGRSVH